MNDATLIYELDTDKRINIKSGTLVSIDNETLDIRKPSLLMQKYKSSIMPLLSEYKDYIKNNPTNKGRFVIEYVKDSEIKEQLPVIYKHGNFSPILTRTIPISIDTLKQKNFHIEKSEVEKARQLLLSSKYKRFLKAFLASEMFKATTNIKMKASKDEYTRAKAMGLEGFITNDQFGLTVREAFIYLYKTNRLGPMRILVEDALELWKKNLETLNDERLYYYARGLRSLIDDYYDNVNRSNKAVVNLSVNKVKTNTKIIKDINCYRPLKTGVLIKKKAPRAA